VQVNKVIVDKARLLRRAIVISWASLFLCFIIKVFGGNFFDIICDNPNYIALCDYADEHFWLKWLIAIVSSSICQILYTLAIIQEYKFKGWQRVVLYPSIVVSCFVKLKYQSFGIIFDIWLTVFIPMIFLGKRVKSYLSIIIGVVLVLLFQIISLLVKNIGFVNVADDYFVGLIYMIDLYLMCLLYYLYRNYKKESDSMGALWVFFAGKPTARLEKMKARREAKIKKYEAENNAIDVELSKRKKDEK
jgi:hypothetical protein